MAGFILFFAWSIKTEIALEKEGSKISSYFYSVDMEMDIERRLEAIESKNFDGDRMDWVPSHFSIEEEVRFLTRALNRHRDTIEKYKVFLESNTREEIKIFRRLDVQIALVVYLAFMVFLTWFGFSRWIKKVHLMDEELRNLDRNIKIKNLEKLEMEIKALKLANYSNNLRRRSPVRAFYG